MPINFDEEEIPKRRLETCRYHGLKFDPEMTWGCVLCKKGQKKRISWILVVGEILFIAVLAFYLVPWILGDQEESGPRLIIESVPADTGEHSQADLCRMKVSKKIESCFAKYSGDKGTQIDKEICLDCLESFQRDCADSYDEQDAMDSPIYGIGKLPDWGNVREKVEQTQRDIEKCVDGMSYKFAIRVSVNGDNGTVQEVAASAFGVDSSERQCIYDLFKQLEFPRTYQGRYTFTAYVDSNLLQKNRPKVVDENQSKYEEFVKKKRQEAAAEERRAQLMEARREREKEYQEYLKKKSD